jgi:transient receptor potential cation channel subfamily A protein 1
MAENNRAQLLAHPVVEALLFYKQKHFGTYSFLLSLGIYLIFLFFLTYFVVDTEVKLGQEPDLPGASLAAGFILVVFCGLRIASELLQMAFQGARYFMQAVNLLEWLMLSFAMAFLSPFLENARETKEQWSAGALTLWFAWIGLLLFVRKIDRLGIYVLMFEETLKTVAKVNCGKEHAGEEKWDPGGGGSCRNPGLRFCLAS